MFCPECGKEVGGKGAFCRFCGHKMRDADFIGRLRDFSYPGYLFPISLNLIILGLVMFFHGNISLFVSYFLVLFVPGYFFLKSCFNGIGEVNSSILSLPVSVCIIGLPLFLISLFGIKIVSVYYVVFIDLFLVSFFVWSRRKELGRIRGRAPYLDTALVFIIIIGSFVMAMGSLTGGSLVSPYPYMLKSFDTSEHLAQAQYSLDQHNLRYSFPALADNVNFAENYFAPFPMAMNVILSEVSKAEVWDTRELFLVLSFIWMNLGLFMLYGKIVKKRIAGFVVAVGSLLLICPLVLFPAYMGLWNLSLSMMILPFALFCLLELYSNFRFSYLVIFLVVLVAMFHTHATDILIISLLLVIIMIKEFRKILRDPVHFVIPFVIALILIAPYFYILANQYIPTKMAEGQGDVGFHSPKETEDKFRPYSVVLPNLSNTPILILVLFVLDLFFLGYMCYKYWTIEKEIKKNKRFAFLMVAVPLMIISAGFTYMMGEYTTKMRFILLSIFILPMAIIFVWEICDILFKAFSVKNSEIYVFFGILVCLVIVSNIGYYYNNKGGIIDEKDYNILKWINANTKENDTILAYGIFPQRAGLMAWRNVVSYVDVDRINQDMRNNVMPSSIVPETNCKAVIRRGLFNVRFVRCDDTFFMKVCNYDYIILPVYLNQPYFVSFKNSLTNYQQVFIDEKEVVLRRIRNECSI